jgi:type IV pilus assembly protein PilZ
MDESAARSPANRAGMLSLSIKEKAALYAAYMPFLRNGGLFVPTNRAHQMGDQVYMLLSLMDDPSKIPLSGKVVWITPPGAQGNRQQGIGVQFDENDAANAVRGKIESILGNSMKATRQTHTL